MSAQGADAVGAGTVGAQGGGGVRESRPRPAHIWVVTQTDFF